MKRSLILGPTEGWSLESVAAWLLGEGRFLPSATELMTGLMAQLDAAGAKIDRVRLTMTTLHPQVLAWGVFWDRELGARPWSAEHGVQNADAYVGSPNQYVRDERKPFRRRLDVPPEPEDHATLADLRAEGIVDYLALPLVFGSGIANVLTVGTRSPAGFSDDDLERITVLSSLLAPMFEILATRRVTLGLLDAFVGPRTSERIR